VAYLVRDQQSPQPNPALARVTASTSAEIFLETIQELRETGHYTSAIELISKRLREPGLSSAFAARGAMRLQERRSLTGNLADLCLQFGAFEESLALYDDLIDELETDEFVADLECLKVWVRRASVYLAMANTEDALGDLAWLEPQFRILSDRAARLELVQLLRVRSQAELLTGKELLAEKTLLESAQLWESLHQEPAIHAPLERYDTASANYSMSLGLIRMDQRRFEEAILDLHRATQIFTDWLGPQHPETARVLIYLSRCAQEADFPWPDLPRMIDLATGVLQKRVRFDHPDALMAERLSDRMFDKPEPTIFWH
jgi:tetratricopeptide (TPR) repeat protein